MKKWVCMLFVCLCLLAGAAASLAQGAYLTFTGEQAFTLVTKYNNKTWDGLLEYSTDAATWQTWDGTEISSAANAPYTLHLRGTGNTKISSGMNNGFVFSAEGEIRCEGNIMTLLDYAKAQAGESLTMADSCFSGLFEDNANLISAPELPAMQLANYCYMYMFSGCTSLERAPELPATQLTNNCYSSMFSGCTSLVSAPQLPAMQLANYCYMYMFSRCTSLERAPELPATQLTNNCYEYMFMGCESLESAPELPATQLAVRCYAYMFSGCTSLKSAPQLPATQLARICYMGMFSRCTSLESAPQLPAMQLEEHCYSRMFSGCTSLERAPQLPAMVLAESCYRRMFNGCTSLAELPQLPATQLAKYCYIEMFSGCSGIGLFDSPRAHCVPWGIPAGAIAAEDWNVEMLKDTDGQTCTEEPAVGTVYYQWSPDAHEYLYAANGSEMLESCVDSERCGYSAKATLSAPAGELKADGSAHEAALTYGDTWNGGRLTIAYERDGVPVTDTTKVGEYVASVSIGGARALLAYTVKGDLAGTLTLTGTPTIGQTLTAHYAGGAPGETAELVWMRVDAQGNETLITENAGKETYLITKADVGYVIKAALKGTGVYEGGAAPAATTAVEATDPTALHAAIAAAQAIGNNEPPVYTQQSYAAFAAARKAAEELAANTAATQAEIEAAAQRLESAINALALLPEALPQTGDESRAALWGALLALSACTLALLRRRAA